MIPHVYPSRVNTTTGKREMVVHSLSSISGLQRWVDYIPVKFTEDSFPREGTTENDGFIAVSYLDTVTGLVAYGDYVPVYIDHGATDAWIVSAIGYIPVEYSGRSTHRAVRTFDGIDTYGTLQEPETLAAGDTVEVVFASSTTLTLRDLLDGVLQFDALDLLQLTNCTATIDGVAVADGASIAAYLDSVLHTIVLTMTGADTVTYIGQNGLAANYFAGEILSVKFTDNSGASPVVTNYVLDNDSLVFQQARGYALGSELIPFSDGETSFTDTSEPPGSSVWVSDTLELSNPNGLSTEEGAGGWSFDTVIGETYYLSVVKSGGASITQVGSTALMGGNIYQSSNNNNDIGIFYTAITTTTYVTARNFSSTTTAVVNSVSNKQAPKSLVYSNFTASDIEQFTYNQQTGCWEAAVHADICYV